MANYESERNGITASSVILAFLSGAAIGAAAALLLAPQSGRESREQLRRYAKETEENLRGFADRAGDSWGTAVEKGKQILQEQKTVLSEAMEAGRRAMQRERERRTGERRSGEATS